MANITGGPFKGPDGDSKDIPASSEKTSSPPSIRDGVNDAGYGSSDEHIFSDPSIADYWRKVYEKAHYENRHRFDPSFKWTAEEEKAVVKKVGFTAKPENKSFDTPY